MLDKPAVDEGMLAAQVAATWAVDVAGLVFMPVGLDGHAWGYQVDASGGARYFLKMRRGEFTPAAALLPEFLLTHGVGQVVAPIAAPNGAAGRSFRDYRLLLYPFC